MLDQLFDLLRDFVFPVLQVLYCIGAGQYLPLPCMFALVDDIREVEVRAGQVRIEIVLNALRTMAINILQRLVSTHRCRP